MVTMSPTSTSRSENLTGRLLWWGIVTFPQHIGGVRLDVVSTTTLKYKQYHVSVSGHIPIYLSAVGAGGINEEHLPVPQLDLSTASVTMDETVHARQVPLHVL